MKHLTDEQIVQWLERESDPQAQEHLESCAQCRAEAHDLQDRISRYSISLRRQAASAQAAHLAGNLAPRQALVRHRLRWAAAAALGLLLTAQTAWMMKPRPAPPVARPIAAVPAQPKPAAMSDDELLEAVNSDLNREVPQALAPIGAITVARNEIAAASTGTTTTSNSEGEQR